jgi:hypothetical protein
MLTEHGFPPEKKNEKMYLGRLYIMGLSKSQEKICLTKKSFFRHPEFSVWKAGVSRCRHASAVWNTQQRRRSEDP